jgi:hypothetical protein
MDVFGDCGLPPVLPGLLRQLSTLLPFISYLADGDNAHAQVQTVTSARQASYVELDSCSCGRVWRYGHRRCPALEPDPGAPTVNILLYLVLLVMDRCCASSNRD